MGIAWHGCVCAVESSFEWSEGEQGGERSECLMDRWIDKWIIMKR